jgi:phosphatidate cytidylyltransferase
MIQWDRDASWLAGGVLGVLVVASVVGAVLSRVVTGEGGRRTVANLNARTKAWWVMVGVFGAALAAGRVGVIVLFALVSFLALREVLTLTPTRRADHRALFWTFFVVVPVQYGLVYADWYGLYSIFIPVYAFLFLSVRSAAAGDVTRFMERAAKVHWAEMVCVYCVSHAAALMMLDVPGYEGENWKLVVFLAAVVQMSDVLQYVWGKLFGRTKVAPVLSPSKTVEGLVGGVLSATGLGMGLWWATPFTPWEAAGLALVVALMGFFGGLVMSAIKRDAGVKDYGDLIAGHGGMMDRVDSLAFAAPVFFHLVRYFYEG